MFRRSISHVAARRIRAVGFLVLASGLAGCAASTSAHAETTGGQVNYEGLADADSRTFDIAQVRPGTDFSMYTGVVLEVPELAYRAADGSVGEFSLSEEQKEGFRDLLRQAFEAELGKLAHLKLVGEPGNGILRLSIRVEDISATVAPRSASRVGRAAALLEASADATLVLELRDSRSNTILARGVDARSAEGVAMRQPDRTVVTRFEDVEKVCQQWASAARKGLKALTEKQ